MNIYIASETLENCISKKDEIFNILLLKTKLRINV